MSEITNIRMTAKFNPFVAFFDKPIFSLVCGIKDHEDLQEWCEKEEGKDR